MCGVRCSLQRPKRRDQGMGRGPTIANYNFRVTICFFTLITVLTCTLVYRLPFYIYTHHRPQTPKTQIQTQNSPRKTQTQTQTQTRTRTRTRAHARTSTSASTHARTHARTYTSASTPARTHTDRHTHTHTHTEHKHPIHPLSFTISILVVDVFHKIQYFRN